ncbi:acyl transferase/acyl hydrolase/lysophospholipase [Phyllosticta citrichinensis]|uniref:Lysophospholipase n=1 Tax=Phyllosticta citrichinensis TaxID=1130410 RepID=A0ABR1XLD9_9PEZI
MLRCLQLCRRGSAWSLLRTPLRHRLSALSLRRGAGALALATCTGGLALYACSEQASHDFSPARRLLLRTESNSKNTEDLSHKNTEVADRPKVIHRGKEFQYGKDEGKPGQQPPPSQARVAVGDDKETDVRRESVWDGVVVAISSLPETVSGLLVPDWVRTLPAFITKLQNELSMAPGSLAEEIWHDAHDPEINPEIVWDARVRISNELCEEERRFLQKRKLYLRQALARYLDLDENEIHPDDVPTIAMCGSGGGLRALVATSSSYLSASEAGLFDCVTYTAGVSGSCWLQALYYSSITGQSHQRLINHLKNRLGIHICYPPPALAMINSAPTNKYLLSGMVEKYKGVPGADFGIVDIYGLLLAARLMVPKGELGIDYTDMKISNQRRFVDNGVFPLPIYTAVRHEIPPEEQNSDGSKKEAWFQWFEFTPYEMWSEELGAGIPTWAVGRQFYGGKGLWRDNGLALPELRIPLMLGIWGSAFCATLSHYYKEIRPILRGLTGFGGIDEMIAERDQDLARTHPIDPAVIPNYALGLQGSLPPTCPESMFTTSNLQLMDAGMSNNLPIYPLLRPGRDVDMVIAFDASADVRTDNWLKVAEGYTKQRGIIGWPVGAGWPPAESSEAQIQWDLDAAQAESKEDAAEKVAEAQEEQEEQQRHQNRMGKKRPSYDLGYCNVWVGTSEQRVSDEGEQSVSKQVEDDWELMRPDAGITVVYFPFLGNPKVEGVDPRSSDFMSTWNFVYTPEDIEKVVELARANFDEGKEQTRRAVRAVYERKKTRRLEREAEEKERRRRWKLRSGRAGKKMGEGDHCDHFS